VSIGHSEVDAFYGEVNTRDVKLGYSVLVVVSRFHWCSGLETAETSFFNQGSTIENLSQLELTHDGIRQC